MTICTDTQKETVDVTQEDVQNALKRKVLCEVDTLVNLMGKGYSPDVRFILLEITLLDMLSHLDSMPLDQNFSLYALQFYLNNSWQQSLNLR